MQLRGVQFGQYHTAEDWGLTMHIKRISPPMARTNYVQVPGRSGTVDLSEAISGDVEYEDREAEFEFILTEGSYADRELLITNILGVVHGKRLQLIDTDDYPDYYLNGRFMVTEAENNNAYGTIKIEGQCEPWRYANYPTSKDVTLNNVNQTVNIIVPNNGYKTLIPTLTVDGSVTVSQGGTSKTLHTGTYLLRSLRLAPGVNVIQAAGLGTLTITYTEAIF